jgi:hypothetical protein
MANLAACLIAMGRQDEAMAMAEQGAAMASRLLAETHPIRQKCDSVLAEVRRVAGADSKP